MTQLLPYSDYCWRSDYVYPPSSDFVRSFISFSYFLVPRLKRAGITGHDVNKPDKPEVAEMGGFFNNRRIYGGGPARGFLQHVFFIQF